MEIEVAAYGWQGGEWEAFYPEGLPPEWRLGYYANEFFAIVVPADHWQGERDEVLLAWPEELHETFRLYWEVTSAAAAARLERLQETAPRLAAHLGGRLWREEGGGWRLEGADGEIAHLYLEQALEPRRLRQAIEVAAGAAGRVLVVVAPAAHGVLRALLPLSQMMGG